MSKQVGEEFATKTCVNGHTGDWYARDNRYPSCRTCMLLAVKKHRALNPHGIPKAGNIDALKAHIESLEKALEKTKKKLELSLELLAVQEKLKQL